MKKVFGVLFAATMMFSSAIAKEKKPLPEVKEVVLLTDLTPGMTKELMAGNRPEMAVECKEGTELPFQFVCNYDLFSVNFTPNLSVKVEKPFYFRLVGSKGYISFDLKNWKKPGSFRKEMETTFGISPDKSRILVEANLLADFED